MQNLAFMLLAAVKKRKPNTASWLHLIFSCVLPTSHANMQDAAHLPLYGQGSVV